MRNFARTIAGVIAGMALVIACGHSGMMGSPDAGIADANAGADTAVAPSDCAQWQISALYPDTELPSSGSISTNSPIWDVPAGWEPIGYGIPTSPGARSVLVRRCKP